MANGKVHAAVGVVAGGGAAALVAKNEEPLGLVLQTLAGIAGGYAGGIAPDVFEPAHTPLHRGPAHSVLALVGGTTAMTKKGSDVLGWLRTRLRELEAELAITPDPWQRLAVAVGILACHVAIGYGVGFAAGYASHLALDAVTPGSLPLLTGRSR